MNITKKEWIEIIGFAFFFTISIDFICFFLLIMYNFYCLNYLKNSKGERRQRGIQCIPNKRTENLLNKKLIHHTNKQIILPARFFIFILCSSILCYVFFFYFLQSFLWAIYIDSYHILNSNTKTTQINYYAFFRNEKFVCIVKIKILVFITIFVRDFFFFAVDFFPFSFILSFFFEEYFFSFGFSSS